MNSNNKTIENNQKDFDTTIFKPLENENLEIEKDLNNINSKDSEEKDSTPKVLVDFSDLPDSPFVLSKMVDYSLIDENIISIITDLVKHEQLLYENSIANKTSKMDFLKTAFLIGLIVFHSTFVLSSLILFSKGLFEWGLMYILAILISIQMWIFFFNKIKDKDNR